MKGKGLSVQLYGCRENVDEKGIRKLIARIIDRIGMKALGRIHVAVGKPEMPGISAVQIIETSHIALHSFTGIGRFAGKSQMGGFCYMFQLESCKDFDEQVVQQMLKSELVPTDTNAVSYGITLPDEVVNV